MRRADFYRALERLAYDTDPERQALILDQLEALAEDAQAVQAAEALVLAAASGEEGPCQK